MLAIAAAMRPAHLSATVPAPVPVHDEIIDLDGALRRAGLANPTVGLAEEVVRANQAAQLQARALLFPSLHAGATFSWHQGNLLSAQGVMRDLERESLYVGAGADTRGAGTVAVPGVLLTSHLGDSYFAPRTAREKVLSSSLDAQATRNHVLLQVAHAYLALVGAEARRLALEQGQAELEEVTTRTANFAATGQGREGDAQRARGEALLLQSATLAAQEAVALRSVELARLVSMDPSLNLRPAAGTLPVVELVDANIPLEALLQEALARRPEISARAADIALGELRLRQERVRPLVPTVTVGFSAGDFGGGGDQVPSRLGHFNSRADFDVLAVWSARNLGLGNRAEQKRARSEIGQAEAERARAMDMVRREVVDALSQARAQRQLLETTQKRVASAQRAFDGDLARTKNLQGRLLEVLDSFNLLQAARADLISAMVTYSQAQWGLYVALGNSPSPLPR